VKKIIAAALVLFAVLACRKEDAALRMEATSNVATDVAEQGSMAVAGVRAYAAAPANTAAPFRRMIVRTANVSIIVRDTDAAMQSITRQAEALGGYVSDSKVWRDGELLRATLTLRVPAEKLTPALASIRGAAKRVESEAINSEDVSQEYVDLESQLRNLEATEVELRQLLTTIREKTRRAADVLEVHQQLTAIRSQIEQIRGRMRYLSQVSALSAINLSIIPDAIAQPIVQPGWQPLVVAKNAGRALVVALQGLATALIWFLIYLAPIILGFVLAAFLISKLIARLLRGTALANALQFHNRGLASRAGDGDGGGA
jgi:hypothetical protein